MKHFFLLPLLLLPCLGFGQSYFTQYFDGADTSASNSLFVVIDTSYPNVWQIGPPQKSIFDSAATFPNAVVTDTINFYPNKDSSSFSFAFPTNNFWGHVLAIRWKQKIDFGPGDGGIVEYMMDTVNGWKNPFNDPYTYNFYGFNPDNAGPIDSEEGFIGTDSLWRDIWLCFDLWAFIPVDTVLFRFRLKSDSIDTNNEGWIIDNLQAHITFVHTIKEKPSKEYLSVYPTLTDGLINIEAEKQQGYHIIENLQVINMAGRVVQQHVKVPTKFFIDIGDQPAGMYYLRVQTNVKTKTVPLFLQPRQH